MLGLASSLGCPNVNNSPDVGCLCKNKDFGYGIRDCATQACPSGTDLNQIIAFGNSYCSSGKSSCSKYSKSPWYKTLTMVQLRPLSPALSPLPLP